MRNFVVTILIKFMLSKSFDIINSANPAQPKCFKSFVNSLLVLLLKIILAHFLNIKSFYLFMNFKVLKHILL